jgi:Protein of unknown function (DUF2804)
MAIPPWRGPAPGRPALPLPPERMPLLRGGRPLKSWTYVGAYGPDLMLCAAHGRIGVVPFSWWAVWDGERLTEGRRREGRLELVLDAGAEVEVVSPHGRQYAWTRKRVARARGTFDGRPFDLAAIVDESAGYHARHTSWRWSAGVGVLASGEPVAWNLVEGLHDARDASERTVWVAGEPRQVPPVRFDGLSGVDDLRFTAVANRAQRENYLLIRSDYEQPFGTFAGELPGAGELREGWGVMERHEVFW